MISASYVSNEVRRAICCP